ncbi:SDR family NAD(P)-dependent oxidoreductase [Enterococcus sp. MJM12]|uniref:SDR family NAD(P)-dependent oxidoreductase n=1 Tax=Candidatus Enterococcus myersii TaxID=2815322 RepID=A0ABS3H5Y7_9ENTE|nr:NAD-dependent epimerase/dehydratase family protein [Enterococcus sp. MJM12]MBO0448867.1 SDR family NAD(P)-dependent oxidoreductase [Enterococcus sp. MJM12]
MKYLITGGAGFIGSSLAKELIKNGHEVTVIDDLSMGKKENLDIERIHFVEGDIRNKELMEKLFNETQFDYVFLLAAIASVADSIQRPIETHEVNLDANLNILELIKEKQKNIRRVVFASSAAVYGDDPSLPKKENSQIKPLSPYAVDKFASEQFVLLYNDLYNVPGSAVRFFNVYGMNQNPQSPYSGVLSIITDRYKQKVAGENAIFNVFGDGKQERDFVFIDDVVQALILVSESKNSRGNVYNVGTGKATSLNKIISIYDDYFQSSLKINYLPTREGDIRYSYSNIDKLKSLGFTPKYSVENGIKLYLENEL